MQNIQAIVFDLGRVLVDVDLSRGLLKFVPNTDHKDDLQLMEELFSDPLFMDYGKGKYTPEDFFAMVKDRWQLDISFHQFKEKWCDVFHPMPGMDRLIQQLGKSYKLGLLSDVDPLHWTYVKENYIFINVIENPTLSFQIGYLKPHPNTYAEACKNVGVDPPNCLFIDDRQINVQGARAFGMQAVQFKGNQELMKYLKQNGLLK
ncbi:MAG: HAD-IA family hydrolase [Caldithrix sp.]|nr:HAD-IA family hydrolase [Caldithrix sp.]